MSAAPSGLPRWDMSSVFPSLSSDEFAAAVERLDEMLSQLEQAFAEHAVGAERQVAVTPALAAIFDQLTAALNALLDHFTTVRGYVHAFVATNAADDLAQARMSELHGRMVRISKLRTQYDAWVGALDLSSLTQLSATAQSHSYMLAKAQVTAKHQMSIAEEDLAAHLSLSGGTAWAKLHANLSSRLMVRVPLPDGEQEMPMSAVRNLANHSDAEVRERAYHAELAAWDQAAVPLAAAMNGVKGEVAVLSKRRNWPSALAAALHHNNIDAETLAAMQAACVAAFPQFRRYLRVKAHLLGKSQLPWYDLFAPVGATERVWSFAAGRDFIIEQFGTYSDKLAAFAERAFREQWIDAEPRRGKRDGAFCMAIRPGESRILSNYSEISFSSVSTLAHELGHGYHNLCLKDRTPLQRNTPMTLAETASIFCQTLITQAALKVAAPAERLGILEGYLRNACQVVVDIHSRFLFEDRVFAARAQRELSVEELNELMLQAQRETYGDGLDPAYLHRYMWAVKPHYYDTARSYYNFPYTFGLLFGLGLYAQYEKDPDGFRARYDELLSSTGLADAATLAGRFGFDIRSQSFWEASLNVISRNCDEFAALAHA